MAETLLDLIAAGSISPRTALTIARANPHPSFVPFVVTALDQGNHTATGYTGTVHFSSSDGNATLPANSTLTNGVGAFSATLRTAGTQTLTATDTASSSVTGTGTIAVSVVAATHLAVSAPATAR